jgi:hypothetical protein
MSSILVWENLTVKIYVSFLWFRDSIISEILNKVESIKINKYLIIGLSFSVFAIGLFSLSAYLFLEHSKCALVWNDKNHLPPYMGGPWCGDELIESSRNVSILGTGMSSVTITMLIIYFKKW